jgi:hypothetical protein
VQLNVADVVATTRSDWHELTPSHSITHLSQEMVVPWHSDTPQRIVHTPSRQTPFARTHPEPHGLVHSPIALPVDVHVSVAGQPLPPCARQPWMQRPVFVSQTWPLAASPHEESSVHRAAHTQVSARQASLRHGDRPTRLFDGSHASPTNAPHFPSAAQMPIEHSAPLAQAAPLGLPQKQLPVLGEPDLPSEAKPDSHRMAASAQAFALTVDRKGLPSFGRCGTQAPPLQYSPAGHAPASPHGVPHSPSSLEHAVPRRPAPTAQSPHRVHTPWLEQKPMSRVGHDALAVVPKSPLHGASPGWAPPTPASAAASRSNSAQ